MIESIPVNLPPLHTLPGGDTWQARHTAGGILCWDASPEAQPAVDLLNMLVDDSDRIDRLSLLSTVGTHANVYTLGALAVKVFGKRRSSYQDNISGIAYLQMSVALQAGLAATEQSNVVSEWATHGTGFVYTAPRMYGSFITTERRSAVPPITIMSLEEGAESQASKLPAPSYRTRRDVCRDAVELAGLPPRYVAVDRNRENVLLSQLGDDTIQVTQLDILTYSRGFYPL